MGSKGIGAQRTSPMAGPDQRHSPERRRAGRRTSCSRVPWLSGVLVLLAQSPPQFTKPQPTSASRHELRRRPPYSPGPLPLSGLLGLPPVEGIGAA